MYERASVVFGLWSKSTRFYYSCEK